MPPKADPPASLVDALVGLLSGLRIGDGNQITINVGSNNNNNDNEHHEVAGDGVAPASAPSGSSSSSSVPAAKAAARQAKGPRKRFYVIAYCPRDPSLVGVWHLEWFGLDGLASRLPGGQLFGSTARPVKGFDSREEAVKEWERYHPERVPEFRGA